MIFYRLDFDDPKFRKGFQTTLRLGRKHFDAITKLLRDHETVVLKLCKTNCDKVVSFGTLRSIECLYWDQLSKTEIATNHVARDEWKLKNAMMDAYAKIITNNDELTMIGFDIMHDDDDNDGGEDIINTPSTPPLSLVR